MAKVQEESKLQREIVEYLNGISGLGCYVIRLKNAATYDPTSGVFRANTTIKGIPDIIGTAKNGQSIYIEVKMLGPNGQPKGYPSKEQKELLSKLAEMTPFVGVAYDMGDAYDIVANDPERYPRKLRTYSYDSNRKKWERSNGTRKTATKTKDPVRKIIDLSGPAEPEPAPEYNPDVKITDW